jgi:hypothetical protein
MFGALILGAMALLQRSARVSPQLATLLSEQVERQKAKGHSFWFSTSPGTVWDISLFRKRKMKPLLWLLFMTDV